MKVLLVNIYRSPDHLGGYYGKVFAQMPPITLAILAAALEAAGIDVQVYDDALAGGDASRLEAAVRQAAPTIVGLSLITSVMSEAPRVVAAIRAGAPEAHIVAGNIHAGLYHEELLRSRQADVVVHGEGEVTLVELARELSRPSVDLSRVLGISFLDGERVVATAPRPYVENLDSLPFPAWHLFPMSRYRILSFARVRDPGFLVLGSRGCPFGCTYCSLRVMGRVRRCRSVANIADEVEAMHSRYGWVQPSFVDPIFPLTKREGLAYAAELVRRGLHRRQVWITETRTDLVDLELMQALRESGLRRVMFGFEVADPEELSRLRKGASVDAGMKAVEACRKAGVQVVGFFMLGVPGATRESMQRSIDYAKELDLDFAKYTVFVPYPGTPLHDDLLASGRLRQPDNWRRYTSYPTHQMPPVYLPDGLDDRTIVAFQRKAHLSFYLRPRIIARQLLRIRSLTARDFADALSAVAASVLGGLR